MFGAIVLQTMLQARIAELGEHLLGIVVAARQRGWDAEDALRTAVRRYADELDAASPPTE